MRDRTGWRRVKFGEMAEQINERVDDPKRAGASIYVGLEHLDSDSLKIRRWGSPDEVEATKLRFYKGDIIFGRRRAYQRKLGVAEFEGICSAHAMVLRARPDVVVPEFLPFFMQSDVFMKRAQEISVGSLSPTINWTTLREQEFDLPSHVEQTRMAALLHAHDEAIYAQTALLDSLKNAQKEMFRETCRLVVSSECTVADVADVVTGGTPRRNVSSYWNGSMPWLPTGKVNDRVVRCADEFVTAEGMKDARLVLVPRLSTLVAMIGEGKTRGMAAILDIDATVNQNFAAIIPRCIDSWFLFYFIESQYDALRAWSQGTNQHALNRSLVMSFPILLPSGNSQVDISGKMRALDELVVRVENRMHELKALRTLVVKEN